MPTNTAIRLYDYPYTDWRMIADRVQPKWTEEQFDASWDEHIQIRVWAADLKVQERC